MESPVTKQSVDQLQVEVYATRQAMGAAAAAAVIAELQLFLAKEPEVNMVFAAAPSQNEFLAALIAAPDVAWSRVNAFHLDEYIGLPVDAPQRFATFLTERLFSRLPFRTVNILNGNAKPTLECQRYTDLLAQHPFHIACIGIGENGHIAFNDPPVADFDDPHTVKIVELEERCRNQQVHDGCFPTVAAVPTHALTLTIPAIMAAQTVFCIVPGPTKQEAVWHTVKQPILPDCPASIMRRHKHAVLYVDIAAAKKIL